MKNSHSNYYNTNGLTGGELKNAVRNATNQETKILRFFVYNPGLFTSEEIQFKCSLMQTPLTSICRALTNLSNGGFIRKTDVMKKGMYGKPIHAYQLIAEGQGEMF